MIAMNIAATTTTNTRTSCSRRRRASRDALDEKIQARLLRERRASAAEVNDIDGSAKADGNADRRKKDPPTNSKTVAVALAKWSSLSNSNPNSKRTSRRDALNEKLKRRGKVSIGDVASVVMAEVKVEESQGQHQRQSLEDDNDDDASNGIDRAIRASRQEMPSQKHDNAEEASIKVSYEASKWGVVRQNLGDADKICHPSRRDALSEKLQNRRDCCPSPSSLNKNPNNEPVRGSKWGVVKKNLGDADRICRASRRDALSEKLQGRRSCSSSFKKLGEIKE